MKKNQEFICNNSETLLKVISCFNKDLSNKTIKNYIK